MTKTEWLAMLEHSYETQRALDSCPPETRYAYLSEQIFDFTTYDGEMDDLFGRKAVEVCAAINDRKTFDYIANAENHRWYLLMCNMPFFYPRLEWGTSIRGAWWDHGTHTLHSCGLWKNDEQLEKVVMESEAWHEFVAAMVEFADPLRTRNQE